MFAINFGKRPDHRGNLLVGLRACEPVSCPSAEHRKQMLVGCGALTCSALSAQVVCAVAIAIHFPNLPFESWVLASDRGFWTGQHLERVVSEGRMRMGGNGVGMSGNGEASRWTLEIALPFSPSHAKWLADEVFANEGVADRDRHVLVSEHCGSAFTNSRIRKTSPDRCSNVSRRASGSTLR
ncbi:hypothetical protein BGZ60DRAFT_253660 [Tricladium varicosporioides]|nr:hypothetical protein BGZ60DRAFT_253660 [Hymenoscyphus varicosporioides]